MADETPQDPQRTGWTPTASTMLAGVGAALAQIICSAWNSFLPGHPIDDVTRGSITVVLVFVLGFVHPDGGRK